MTAAIPHLRLALAAGICVTGLAVYALTWTPIGLLAPVAGLGLLAGPRGGAMLVAGLGLAALVAALAGLHSGGEFVGAPAGHWCIFFVTALCVGLAVMAAGLPPPRSDAGAGGRDPGERPAAALAAARAFRTCVPRGLRHRLSAAEGGDQRAGIRSDPGCPAGTEGEALAPQGDIGAGGPAENPEVVRAARVVEALFGNAWALAPDGRWICPPRFAGTGPGLSPHDLNASLAEGEVAWHKLVHPEEYERVALRWRHSLRTGEPWKDQFRIRRASGGYAWARSTAHPLRDAGGRILGWYGTSVDIDVYRKTMENLLAREREISHLVDVVPGHLCRLAPDGTPLFFNRRMAEFHGLEASEAQIPGLPPLEGFLRSLVHPDDVGPMLQVLSQCMEAGGGFSWRYRLRRADGVYRWVAGRAEPTRDEEGRVLEWFGVCTDIEDQMRAEQALRSSERLHRRIVETLPAMIYCAEPDGRPIYRSRRLSAFLGLTLGEGGDPLTGPERLGATLEEIIHPDELDEVRARYARSLATGEPYAMRHRLRRHDGTWLWVETRAEAMRDAGGNIAQWYGVCFDIEDLLRGQENLRTAQDSLARAARAASLAELSASIAHEVNQPLAAIVANSHACYRWLIAEPPNLERAKITAGRITRDANSAAEVVSRIRALFSQAGQARERLSLAGVIAEARDVMAGEALRRGVRIVLALEEGLPPVSLDRVQVQQVLVNLMSNGMEAMAGGDAEQVLEVRLTRADATGLRAEVRDHGPGLASTERIFQPFVSTKDRGMGMGLAICRSIVEAHGGRLWAENACPRGARFIFTLPLDAKATE